MSVTPSHRISRLSRLLAACTLLASSTCLAGPLDDDVDRILSSLKMGQAKVGISIVDVSSGDTLAAHRSNDALIPASNMKLLSSGAALFTLGPDFVFRTEVLTTAESIIIKGSGDPALGDPELLADATPPLDVDKVIDTLAGAIRKSGPTSLHQIIMDDRVFDRNYVHPSWPVDQLRNWYCAEVSGLNFHTNVISFFLRPSPDGIGRSPQVSIEPSAPWIEIENKAKTIGKGPQRTRLDRLGDDNRFILAGDLSIATQDRVTMHEPAIFFGRLIADRLTTSGTRVTHSQVRLAGTDERFPQTRTIAVISTPISDIVTRSNNDSHNLYAEALCKRVGNHVTKEPGSWENGTAVMRMLLAEKLGPGAASSTTLADGSGMSRLNAVSASTLANWLRVIGNDERVSAVFTPSLATIGTGTLKRRFTDIKIRNEVRAKSGYINGVRCLSGYVIQNDSGKKVAFSVLVNYGDRDEVDREALKLHELVVQAIDRHLNKTSTPKPQIGG
ncbi:MAG: D-alanyl-D-alanine carboxypeptidase/D-alanyl-D-alanine-endopeptidase [Planctomycetes bacterium]|nr:D-alanyl-D-alanine carboxypeptidase/D-alanyl-D-alanine-endopeptidase [Planctomycetota bacterium]